MKWGIIGAMEKEVALLKDAMKDVKEYTYAGKTYLEGKLGRIDAVVTQCGVGKVYAALATQVLIDKFNVTHVINTGVAGGISSKLHVGDIVVAKDAVQHDFDISPLGGVRGYMEGENPNEPTRYIADKELTNLFVHVASKNNISYIEGTIASGDIFVNDYDFKMDLQNRYGAVAAEMEGAAMAQAASINKIPFLIIRSISDLADGSACESFDTFAPKAAKKAADLIIQMANE